MSNLVFPLLIAALIAWPSQKVTAAIAKKPLVYHLAGRVYEGYLVLNDSTTEPRPGVLLAPDAMGIDAKTKDRAEKISALGYIVLVPDLYGKGNTPKDDAEAAAMTAGFKKDRTALRIRMQQGLKVLRERTGADKTRLAAIGRGFGGLAAIELARAGADLKCVISLLGWIDSRDPSGGGKKIKAKVLALYAPDDPSVTALDVAAFEDEMKKSRIDAQLVKLSSKKGEADQKSWSASQDFLKKNL
jgi:dienelactone hydrolase